jgi:hypothetical protein
MSSRCGLSAPQPSSRRRPRLRAPGAPGHRRNCRAGRSAMQPAPPLAGADWVSFVGMIGNIHDSSWPVDLELARICYQPQPRAHQAGSTGSQSSAKSSVKLIWFFCCWEASCPSARWRCLSLSYLGPGSGRRRGARQIHRRIMVRDGGALARATSRVQGQQRL